jgi:hypothetical protein
MSAPQAASMANDAEVANHKWVRDEIMKTLSAEKMAKMAATAASKSATPTMGGISTMGIAVILFGVAAGYAISLANDIKALTGEGGSWTEKKLGGKLNTVIPAVMFGFILLAIALILLSRGSEFIIGFQCRLAFGTAVFALLISILMYVIAIATRKLPALPHA